MRTIVIIGASNVTLSLPVIWSTLTRSVREPFRLIVTAGHGRSFGMPNTVLGRTLPSILECGLWETLDALKPATVTQAIVTDVGNDLLYGADAKQTMDWVNETIDRLLACDARVLVTGLPMDALRGLSSRRFEFFRRLMFPNSTLTLDTALVEGESLNNQLLNSNSKQNTTCTTPVDDWYGFDPIHIRRRCRRKAWSRYLSMCAPELEINQCRLFSDWSTWRGTAERRWKRSRLLITEQPTRQSCDNELWIY